MNAELIDIVPPVAPLPPAPVFVMPMVLAMLALAGAVAVAVWWYRSRKRRSAAARLRQWRRAFRGDALDASALAYRIAADLRDLSGLKRLDAAIVPAFVRDDEKEAWQDFMERLDQLRYRAAPPLTESEAMQLFADARRWQRRAR